MVRNLVKIRPTYEFLISWLMIAGIVRKIVHTHTCTCWLWKRSVIMDDWRWQLQTDWFWWTTAAAVLAINYKQYTVSVFTNLMFVCLFEWTTLEKNEWKRSVIMDDWRWQLQTDWFWWTTAAAVLAINYKQYTVSVFTNLMFVCLFVCLNGQI